MSSEEGLASRVSRVESGNGEGWGAARREVRVPVSREDLLKELRLGACPVVPGVTAACATLALALFVDESRYASQLLAPPLEQAPARGPPAIYGQSKESIKPGSQRGLGGRNGGDEQQIFHQRCNRLCSGPPRCAWRKVAQAAVTGPGITWVGAAPTDPRNPNPRWVTRLCTDVPAAAAP